MIEKAMVDCAKRSWWKSLDKNTKKYLQNKFKDAIEEAIVNRFCLLLNKEIL